MQGAGREVPGRWIVDFLPTYHMSIPTGWNLSGKTERTQVKFVNSAIMHTPGKGEPSSRFRDMN